jgi:hypothetical protein
MPRFFNNMNSTQWFVCLWLAGFLGLALIAGVFKVLLYFAYP